MSTPKFRVESAVKWRTRSGSETSGSRGGAARRSASGTSTFARGYDGSVPARRPGRDFS